MGHVLDRVGRCLAKECEEFTLNAFTYVVEKQVFYLFRLIETDQANYSSGQNKGLLGLSSVINRVPESPNAANAGKRKKTKKKNWRQLVASAANGRL